MKYETKRLLFGLLVIALIVYEGGSIFLFNKKIRFFQGVSGAFLILAGLSLLVSLGASYFKIKKMDEVGRLFDINEFAKSNNKVKVVTWSIITFYIILMIGASYADAGSLEGAFKELKSESLYMFCFLLAALVMPLWYEGIVYEEGMVIREKFVEWENIECYTCHSCLTLKKKFYEIKFKIKSKNHSASLFPKTVGMVVGESEKEKLQELLTTNKIERRSCI